MTLAETVYSHIHEVLANTPFVTDDHLRQVARFYLDHPGKALRPVLLTECCRAFGGSADACLDAASAMEMYHTWTLLHDDVIDHDDFRRGNPTGHRVGMRLGSDDLKIMGEAAEEYGKSLAILAGDLLHAQALEMLGRTSGSIGNSLLRRMSGKLTPELLSGEQQDIRLALTPWPQIRPEEIREMMRLKTGALLAFCAEAGTAIALDCPVERCEVAVGMGRFASRCGLAFQLADDLLGIFGNEAKFGKPVGSDIREGKRTLLMLHTWQHCTPAQRQRLETMLGNPASSEDELQFVRQLMAETGAREIVEKEADALIQEGLQILQEFIPQQERRAPLAQWALALVRRSK